MTKSEFVLWLKDEVTMSGTIEISLSDKEYERLIDKETKMIYELYPEAVLYGYCVIHRSQFYTPEFRNNRIILFPDCVLSVTRFEEMRRRNMMFGICDPDFSFNRMFLADMWMGPHMSLDSVMFRTILWSVWDLLKQYNLVDIRRRWNRDKHQLLVLGHDPLTHVFCEVAIKVPGPDLWEDPWVLKWISAKCKLQVAKKIGTFQVTAIGGVTVNTGLYTEEANNDLTECKEAWKDMQQASWYETGF